MATISTLSNAVGAGTHPSRGIRQMPYVVENTINLASAVTAKGSALAAADVIEALQIPAQSVVLAAGFEVISAVTGSCTVSLGVTGVTAAAYVSAFAVTGSTTVGTYATPATAGYPIVSTAADTLDLLLVTETTTLSAGIIRVFAVISDVQDRREILGLSVDRDQLA
jgi:hypothetical protein